jgi:hypothetical protein
LRRKAEHNSEYTGTSHSYTRLDPGDYESITPDSQTEAIEMSMKARRDKGLLPASHRTVIPL